MKPGELLRVAAWVDHLRDVVERLGAPALAPSHLVDRAPVDEREDPGGRLRALRYKAAQPSARRRRSPPARRPRRAPRPEGCAARARTRHVRSGRRARRARSRLPARRARRALRPTDEQDRWACARRLPWGGRTLPRAFCRSSVEVRRADLIGSTIYDNCLQMQAILNYFQAEPDAGTSRTRCDSHAIGRWEASK